MAGIGSGLEFPLAGNTFVLEKHLHFLQDVIQQTTFSMCEGKPFWNGRAPGKGCFQPRGFSRQKLFPALYNIQPQADMFWAIPSRGLQISIFLHGRQESSLLLLRDVLSDMKNSGRSPEIYIILPQRFEGSGNESVFATKRAKRSRVLLLVIFRSL